MSPERLKEIEDRTYLHLPLVPGLGQSAEVLELIAEVRRLQRPGVLIPEAELTKLQNENQSLRDKLDKKVNESITAYEKVDDLCELLREARDWMAMGANIRGNRVALLKRIDACLNEK